MKYGFSPFFSGPDQVVSPTAGIEGIRADARGRYEFYASPRDEEVAYI
jgi:hypothetical protein